MPVQIIDPLEAKRVLSEYRPVGLAKYDEVWNGDIYFLSLPNIEHQELVAGFTFVVQTAFGWPSAHDVLPGVNVSNRIEDWKENYREPDFAVYLQGNPAINCGTHWCGGPDFLVEIISPGDPTREKLPFYASVNSREVLIVDRKPWQLELYALQNGALVLAGKSDLTQSDVLKSSILPLTFRLVAGTTRPAIEIVHVVSGQTWTV